MAASEHERKPSARDQAHDAPDRDQAHDAPDRDDAGQDDAYERAQPDSQPTVSSEPEPDDDPANAG